MTFTEVESLCKINANAAETEQARAFACVPTASHTSPLAVIEPCAELSEPSLPTAATIANPAQCVSSALKMYSANMKNRQRKGRSSATH